MRSPGRAMVFLLPCLLFLPGCAASFASLARAPLSQDGRGVVYLENVPPVAQEAYQCGPASLESVFHYWGKEVRADAIARALHSTRSRGVLNFALAQHAKEQGFWTEIRASDEETLRVWLRKRIPPIVMLDTGVLWLERYHFAVVRGYHDGEAIFYANTGRAELQSIRYPEFLKRWARAGHWCLVVCPPERVDWDLAPAETAELALLFEKEGRWEAAERRYREALSKDPTHDRIRFNLANVLLKTRKFEEAKSIYLALLANKPAWTDAANNLAWIHVAEGRFQDAVDEIEKAFRHGAQRKHDILDTMGMAWCRLNQREKARACFEEAAGKVPPDNAAALETVRRHLKECL